jgi:hypothetical protein
MTTKQELLILATAAAVMFAIAPFAFADNINQNGVGDSVVSQNGAGNTIINGNGNNSPGSNSPHLSATGGSASAHSSSSSSASANSRNTNVNRQYQGQVQGQSQKATSKVSRSGNSSNSYVAEAQARNPVSTAFAAPLVAADDTCMGSSSAGGQGVGFGLSLGTTWHDEDCVRRKDARELHNMGQKKAALALLCQSDHVAEAMAAAGTACPGRVESLAPAAGDSDEPVRERHARQNAPTDGVVYDYPTGLRRGW